MAVRGTVGLRRGDFPLAMQHMDDDEVYTMTTLEVEVAANRTN
jgi:hypothetical protein